LPALPEQIAASVGGLDLVANRMRQRHLGNFEREAGALGSPIAKLDWKPCSAHVAREAIETRPIGVAPENPPTPISSAWRAPRAAGRIRQ
jgi:hypothetical protein